MKHLECIDRPRLCCFPHSGRSKRRFNISQKGSPSLCGIVPVRSKKFQGSGGVFGNEMTVDHLPPHGRTFNDVQCPNPAWNISQIWNREIIRRNIASQHRQPRHHLGEPRRIIQRTGWFSMCQRGLKWSIDRDKAAQQFSEFCRGEIIGKQTSVDRSGFKLCMCRSG